MMTRLSGRDAWDFEFLGMSRQPFIKTNYPHHEGIWGELICRSFFVNNLYLIDPYQ